MVFRLHLAQLLTCMKIVILMMLLAMIMQLEATARLPITMLVVSSGYCKCQHWRTDLREGGGTNTTYNGPDYNWLGNSFTDNQGSGYNFNEELTADGDVTVTFDDNDTDDVGDDTSITIADTTSYRVESGGFKPTGSETYENTYINYYNDADVSFLGGMETFGFGAEITIYGADRTVLKEAIDTEALRLQALVIIFHL